MEYTPKVGDKVRATLGENVLVGEVAAAADNWNTLLVGPPNRRYNIDIWHEDGWHIEPVLELPTLPGAVIECEGFTYVREAQVMPCPWLRIGPTPGTGHHDAYFTGKQFIVHFAGVQK